MRRSSKFGGGVISRPQVVNDTESRVDSNHNTVSSKKEEKENLEKTKQEFQEVQTSEGKQEKRSDGSRTRGAKNRRWRRSLFTAKKSPPR
jgi:hypothetical protein